jgi:hypothetical protein
MAWTKDSTEGTADEIQTRAFKDRVGMKDKLEYYKEWPMSTGR